MAAKRRANLCGLRVKEARRKLGWSQSELAAALEVDFQIQLTQSDISEIERLQRSVKDYELDAFSKILDVSVDWLMYG
ncbi:helix-turn-helix domain-containing protein [Acaryochloris sp. CCMEE 5410]|uniref:helix-turn-helix domain-containing protein n=1 Tax=Acaryochloris sp. CCMEE 5410 TaxID=310037 RepID=UPI0002E37DD3|nr:helix-turn-helix transcriptional regulator [Acaryochloris sp. CCMEE 5410]KAI9129761.1 helix-turn-helix transcriptional regulator [Acaryochloris sp. CCMEE 5410]